MGNPLESRIPRGKPKTTGVAIAALLRDKRRREKYIRALEDEIERLQDLVDEYEWVLGIGDEGQ